MSGEMNPAGPITRAIEERPAPATCEGAVPMGVYRAGPVALADGDAAPLPLDATGAVRVSSGGGGGPTTVTPAPLSPGAQVTATGQAIAPTANLVIGAFTARETGGAAATITLHRGTANTDPVIAFINLTANQRMGGDWGGGVIDIAAGLYMELTGAAAFVPMVRS